MLIRPKPSKSKYQIIQKAKNRKQKYLVNKYRPYNKTHIQLKKMKDFPMQSKESSLFLVSTGTQYSSLYKK